MAAVFADLPEALANAVEIAKRCNLSIELGKNKLPRFPTPEGVTLEDHLRALAQRGLYTRREGNRKGNASKRSILETRNSLE